MLAEPAPNGNKILSFSGDAEEEEGDDPAVDLFAEASKPDAEGMEEAGDADADGDGEDEAEPEDDFNAAWEVLDLARAIYEKHMEGDDEVRLKVADTFILLGDVSLETGALFLFFINSICEIFIDDDHCAQRSLTRPSRITALASRSKRNCFRCRRASSRRRIISSASRSISRPVASRMPFITRSVPSRASRRASSSCRRALRARCRRYLNPPTRRAKTRAKERARPSRSCLLRKSSSRTGVGRRSKPRLKSSAS